MSKAKLFTLLACFAGLAAPTLAQAAPSVTVSAPNEFAGTASFVAGAKPPATARYVQCHSSAYDEDRRIVFRARMKMFTDTPGMGQKRQMRFDVYRKYNERKRYKRIKADGLSVWYEGSDPMAAIYQRDLSLAEPETSARYYAKVSFRWLASDGTTVEWKRKIVTKPCRMKTALPRLNVLAARHFPVAGTTDHSYRISVMSKAGAEAENVPVHVSVDGAPPVVTEIESIGPGQVGEAAFNAPACNTAMTVTIDPLRTLRMQFKRRPAVRVPC